MIVCYIISSASLLSFGTCGRRGTFTSSGAPHPCQSTLHNVLQQIRAREIFLNLDVSVSYAETWDFPPTITSPATKDCTLIGNWNFFICSQEGKSVGKLRSSQKQVAWVRSVSEDDDVQMASTLISEVPKVMGSDHLCILTEKNSVRNSLIEPNLSPWRQQFQAKRVLHLLSSINCTFCSVFDKEALFWSKIAK